MGKTGERVAVLPPPVFRDNFSGYHPLDGLSSPRLLDPVYPFLLFWGHFLLPRSGGNFPLSAPSLSMETVVSPEGDWLSWQSSGIFLLLFQIRNFYKAIKSC
jgi:hypothetical protein